MHQIILRKGKEEPVKRRHPWIFSGAIDKKPQHIEDGDLVQVVSTSKELLGIGFFSPSSIAVKLLGFGAEGRAPVAELLKTRLADALSLRKALGLLDNPSTNAFRLVNAEGDSLPGLIIDVYDRTAVIQAHSEGMHRQRDAIADLLIAQKDLRVTTVIYDRSGEDQSREILRGESRNPVHIKENGINFLVDVLEGQKTGFFLDQRENRQKIGSLCAGRSVLNVCSYTGGFSVYALHAGAASVTSLDVSKEALALAKENAALNGFHEKHNEIARDCFEYLTNCTERYDCIILDPPAFAKHRGATKNALNGYRSLNKLGFQALNNNGLLATFSCSQLISRDEFEHAVLSAAIESGKKAQLLYRLSQGPCHPTSFFHPEGPYLKGIILRVTT